MSLNWSTEQPNQATADIDTLDAAGVVAAIVAADVSVAGAVAAQQQQIAAAVDLGVAALAAGGRIHYLGAGTSGRLGVLDAVELYPTYGMGEEAVVAHLAGGAQAMMHAVEGAEDDESLGADVIAEAGPNDLVVGIAASGRTPYVRGAMRAARERGLPTVLVSVNPAAPLAELADVAILPDTGPEVVTGSTRMKAGTAQKLVLNTFSTAVMIRLGRTFKNLMTCMVATNAKLLERRIRMVCQATGVDRTRASELLEQTQSITVAIIAALADVPVDQAEAAAQQFPADPNRIGDPSGIRGAVASLQG